MYSTREVSHHLGISPDHMRLFAIKGILKAKSIGSDWVVLDLNYKRKRIPKGTEE
jgi:hypothetical protein